MTLGRKSKVLVSIPGLSRCGPRSGDIIVPHLEAGVGPWDGEDYVDNPA